MIELSPDVRACLPGQRTLYYGGGWHEPLSGKMVPTLDPASGTAIGSVAEADAPDVAAAVAAAQAGFEVWRAVKPADRAIVLREAASRLRANAASLALLDALNTGNPVRDMRNDAIMAAAMIDYFAGLAGELKGQTIPMGPGNLNYTVREPLGVVARLVAYNHPLYFAAAKLGAPLAAGNAVILKAAAQAPLSALRLAELIGDLFPPGVLNVLAGGVECGQALATHPAIRLVSLVGGVETGKAVMRSAADGLKPTLLELGGKNALIVYGDADLDLAVEGAIRGMNFNWAGQSCGSTSRLFLHADVHDMMLDRIVDQVGRRFRPGVPTDPETTMGSLISQAQYEKVLRYIAFAHADGARLVCGGKRCDDPELADGWFVEPTIFADVTMDMRVAREEVFGPVLSVLRWSDENDLYAMVNGLEFGLSASIWTRDINTALRAAARVEAGYVWVNNVGEHFPGAPFGGVKQSGIGREESIEEMFAFSQIKNVNIKLA